MIDDKIHIYASLGDGKLVATLAYKTNYSEIKPEIATPLSLLLKEYYTLKRQLEIAQDLVMDCNIYDIYEERCRKEGLIPEREDDE